MLDIQKNAHISSPELEIVDDYVRELYESRGTGINPNNALLMQIVLELRALRDSVAELQEAMLPQRSTDNESMN